MVGLAWAETRIGGATFGPEGQSWAEVQNLLDLRLVSDRRVAKLVEGGTGIRIHKGSPYPLTSASSRRGGSGAEGSEVSSSSMAWEAASGGRPRPWKFEPIFDSLLRARTHKHAKCYPANYDQESLNPKPQVLTRSIPATLP